MRKIAADRNYRLRKSSEDCSAKESAAWNAALDSALAILKAARDQAIERNTPYVSIFELEGEVEGLKKI